MKITTNNAIVGELTKLNPDVIKVVLITDKKINFLAGQYFDIKYKGFEYRSFSIANMPGTNQLEFHIRLIDSGEFTHFIFEKLKLGDSVKINGPKGDFYLRDGDKDILFVAGGTGIAPIKSIIEGLIASKDKRNITFYWGVRNECDLYSNLPKKWQQLANITYIPVLSENQKWQGKSGFVHNAILEDIDNFNNYSVYACGPPIMAESVATSFVTKGMKKDHFYSDSFSFNSRNK